MQSKAMQSKILLKMQSEAKQSIAQQSNAKQFKAMQSTAQAQHKQSKSKAKAMFRELQNNPFKLQRLRHFTLNPNGYRMTTMMTMRGKTFCKEEKSGLGNSSGVILSLFQVGVNNPDSFHTFFDFCSISTGNDLHELVTS